MKGKTETNSLYEWVNCSLSIKHLKKIHSKHSTNFLKGLHICPKNISTCLKYCDICLKVQIIYSPIRMVRQTMWMLQGLFVNRSSSVHLAFQTVFCYCPFCLSGSQMYKVFPRPLPEKIGGNVNCTRVYRHTCTWRSLQSDRGCDMSRSFLRHLWSRIPW